MKLLALLVLLLLPPGISGAAPSWSKELSSPKFGPHPRLKPMALSYKLSWNGIIEAASLTFVFGRPDPAAPGSYTVRAVGGSRGLARKISNHRIDFTSRLHARTLRPKSFTGVEKDEEELTTTTATFSSRGVTSRENSHVLATGRDFPFDREFRFSPVFDLFSGMLWVRSQKLADGDRLVMAMHPLIKPYLADVTVLGREAHAGQDAIHLRVGLRKISEDMKLLPYGKLHSAELWLSDDRQRIPLAVRCKVKIGDIRMTLVSKASL